MRDATDQPARLIRLAILDDNPFVRLPSGEIRPRAATFHRFAEAVVAAGPFAAAAYLIPVADGDGALSPGLPPVDPSRLRIVATAPFDGIAGYLRRWPSLVRHNWPLVRSAVVEADLVWIKAPASNGPLAAVAARRRRIPYFTWVAGSAHAVVRGQRRGMFTRPVAIGVATAYDAVAGILARTGPAVHLDDQLFTSLVTADEVATTRRRLEEHPGRGDSSEVRLVWAGRMVADKGIDDLLRAIRILRDRDVAASVILIGDGPEREALTMDATQLGVAKWVDWAGYLSDRAVYLEGLRGADLFVLPSRAEGVPKVVVDAMAAGLPVIATRVGNLPRILDHGRLGRLVDPDDPGGLAAAVESLAADHTERERLSELGLEFAARHTIEDQARRLVDWLRASFPRLPWPEVAT
ncbi:MAG: glycosyltransferase family 4 protein [Chloroflexi bacterium]|nr:glycosyltransferase family 4 protein [Chloroflexota bacterium]